LAQLDYQAPSSVEDAVRALAAVPTARVLAGGTDLIVQMRAGRAKPAAIIDLKRIPGAIGVRRDADGAFVIGAATPGVGLGENAALAAAWPGVVEAANLIGSTQIQGRASLGGNLCNASPAGAVGGTRARTRRV
jgi:carbon-monoxide dehydrogenase medium subunit